MKYQILFSGKNKKNTINLLSAETAYSVVKVKGKSQLYKWLIEIFFIQFSETTRFAIFIFIFSQIILFSLKHCKITFRMLSATNFVERFKVNIALDYNEYPG